MPATAQRLPVTLASSSLTTSSATSSLSMSVFAAIATNQSAALPAWHAGFCALTETTVDCLEAEAGAWRLPLAVSRDWRSAMAACARRCAACARCKYVSLSLLMGDCSWFSTCDVDDLSRDVDGFRTFAVRGGEQGGGPSRGVNSVDGSAGAMPPLGAVSTWGGDRGMHNRVQLGVSVASSRQGVKGYCATTVDGHAGDCHAESQGAWLLPARIATWPAAEHHCMQRCLRCERCHFISLSVRYHDCSWFEACDLRQLHSRPSGFRTYELTSKMRNHTVGVSV